MGHLTTFQSLDCVLPCTNKTGSCYAHMDEACHTLEWVVSHIWMGHVTPFESLHYVLPSMSRIKWVILHRQAAHGGDPTQNIWISRCNSFLDFPLEWRGLPFPPEQTCLKFWGLPWKLVCHVRGLPWKLVWNFGCRNSLQSISSARGGWVLGNPTWMSHVTHMNESCHNIPIARLCDPLHVTNETESWYTHMDESLDIHRVTWLFHMCDMTRSCVWRAGDDTVEALQSMDNLWHDSSIRV